MDPVIQVGIAGLDAQQIAVRPGIEPLFIDLAGLFAQGQRHAQGRIISGVDSLDRFQQARNLSDEGRIGTLTALDHHGSEATLRGYPRRREHFFLREFVPLAADIAADTAVETVLDADIGDLDQTPQIDLRADGRHLDTVRLLAKRRFECGILAGNGCRQPFPVPCEF